jgi:hypothetical protein
MTGVQKVLAQAKERIKAEVIPGMRTVPRISLPAARPGRAWRAIEVIPPSCGSEAALVYKVVDS